MALNHQSRYAGSMLLVCVTLTLQSWLPRAALAQQVGYTTATDLVVDGRVEKVFRSGDEVLVQILVQRSEAPQLMSAGSGRYPAPGEYLYVHSADSGRSERGLGAPGAGVMIRAFLKAGKFGQWEAAGSAWYQENPSRDEGGLAKRPAADGDEALGVNSERVLLGRTSALKVLRVRPNSPAAKAGVEPGDILVEANRMPVDSQQELDDLYRRSRDQFSLTVRDVRSGRDVLVKVDPYAGQPGPAMRRGPRSLGVTSKLAFYKGEAAVEVVEVAKGSPADRAGIVPGDLILEADGKPVESPDGLDAMARAAGGVLGLKVVDPKLRRERTVRVAL